MNILDEVQHFVADRLNERLSAYCQFIPENAKTVDYEIKKHLGEQGVVGLVLTPKAQYAGAFEDVGIAWEIPELEVDVVENPTVNRGRALSAVMTGQDLGMAAFDVLCPLSGEGEGRFCPVSYEEGEDGSLLVNRCVVKCLVHPAPPPPPFDPGVNYAVFSDGREVEGWENTWSSAEQFSMFCFSEEVGEDPERLVEAYVYQDFAGFQVFHGKPVLRRVVFGPQVAAIGGEVFDGNGALTSVYFKGKTLAEVQAMQDYPWGLDDVSVVEAELPPGPTPPPWFPDRQAIKMSDGTVIPMGDGFFSPSGYDINTTLRTLGYTVDDVAEIYVFSKLESTTAYREHLKAVYVDSSCPSIGKDYWSQPFSGSSLEKVVFKGRTLEQVQAMQYYPWGLADVSKISVVGDPA